MLARKVDSFKHALTSKDAMVKFLEAPPPRGSVADETGKISRWTNLDLAVSPMRDRKWTHYTYAAFWFAHAAGAGNWMAGSSLISLGQAPLDAYLCLVMAHVLVTILIVLNGRGPARYHIGFPVFARATYGMWGSYMVVAMRAVVCIIWNGTNSYYGARCLTVALTAIWPSFGTLKNTLPLSAAITTRDLTSFIIFMVLFTALSFVHSRDLKWFYTFKSIYVFICMHAILVWYIVKNGGGVGWNNLTTETTHSMTTNTRAWLALRAFNAGLGAASSLTVNQGDMTRYARTPNAAIWTTLFGYPIASALPCLYGILVASASKQLTGKVYWNVWDTMSYMLEQYPDNRGARFGVFLIAFSMVLAYLGVNLATNSLPFGSDVTALFPRWMTIRRGQVICTLLGVCIVPWKILNNAQALITFLSGYGYWLAPIAACMCVDYYLIKKGNLYMPDIFNGTSESRYWFWRGVNIRAVTVTIISLVPCMPSFAAQIDKKHLGFGLIGRNFFYISFTFTYVLAAILYYLSYLAFPEKTPKATEKSLRFEEVADENDERDRYEAATYTDDEPMEGEKVDSVVADDAEKEYAKNHILV